MNPSYSNRFGTKELLGKVDLNISKGEVATTYTANYKTLSTPKTEVSGEEVETHINNETFTIVIGNRLDYLSFPDFMTVRPEGIILRSDNVLKIDIAAIVVVDLFRLANPNNIRLNLKAKSLGGFNYLVSIETSTGIVINCKVVLGVEFTITFDVEKFSMVDRQENLTFALVAISSLLKTIIKTEQ